MVWILLGIGLLLIIFNIRVINKEKNSFQNVFNHTEEDMQEFDFKLSELRREFSETILELQKEIVELKESYKVNHNIKEAAKNIGETQDKNNNEIIYSNKENLNSIKENRIKNDKEDNSNIFNYDYENKSQSLNSEEENRNKDEEYNSYNLYEENKKNEMSNNIKIDEISKLLALGLSIEEISEKLDIGRGEVLLIKELYLK